jgi:hypothetical protein
MTASPSNASVEGVLSAWTRRAVSTSRERHGGQCWKLSVAGNPNVMSMSEPGQLPPRQVHGVGCGQRDTKDGRIREIGRHDELSDRLDVPAPVPRLPLCAVVSEVWAIQCCSTSEA